MWQKLSSFDTVLYQFLETRTSDRCLKCIILRLRFSGFILYPLSFLLYSPFKWRLTLKYVYSPFQSKFLIVFSSSFDVFLLKTLIAICSVVGMRTNLPWAGCGWVKKLQFRFCLKITNFYLFVNRFIYSFRNPTFSQNLNIFPIIISYTHFIC